MYLRFQSFFLFFVRFVCSLPSCVSATLPNQWFQTIHTTCKCIWRGRLQWKSRYGVHSIICQSIDVMNNDLKLSKKCSCCIILTHAQNNNCAMKRSSKPLFPNWPKYLDNHTAISYSGFPTFGRTWVLPIVPNKRNFFLILSFFFSLSLSFLLSNTHSVLDIFWEHPKHFILRLMNFNSMDKYIVFIFGWTSSNVWLQ